MEKKLHADMRAKAEVAVSLGHSLGYSAGSSKLL